MKENIVKNMRKNQYKKNLYKECKVTRKLHNECISIFINHACLPFLVYKFVDVGMFLLNHSVPTRRIIIPILYRFLPAVSDAVKVSGMNTEDFSLSGWKHRILRT